MGTFDIIRGPVTLCSWNLSTRAVDVHREIDCVDGTVTLPEHLSYGFRLVPDTSAGSDTSVLSETVSKPDQYRIRVGDVTLHEQPGILEGRHIWSDGPCFESARGETTLTVDRLLSRDDGEDEYEPILLVQLNIVPSKVGEERYAAMERDLRRISYSLLNDLYGKSQHSIDLRIARGATKEPSNDSEMIAIREALDGLSRLLPLVAQHPASRIERVHTTRPYRRGNYLSPLSVLAMTRRGVDPRRVTETISASSQICRETFDVAEHRVVKMCLLQIAERARRCATMARLHVDAIEEERHLRDISFAGQPSIYMTIDMPTKQRLDEIIVSATRYEQLARSLQRMPFLRGIRPEVCEIKGGTFQRNLVYQRLFSVVRNYFAQSVITNNNSAFGAMTKLTSRLFEQWALLRVVEAFRDAGMDLLEWSDVLRDNLRSRFIIDFDRGLEFEGMLSSDFRLRFRYEPWIYQEAAAEQLGESLFRGRRGDAAWCPDIVIECQQFRDEHWNTVYAIVLDAKYTKQITERHWNDVGKYLEIRETSSRKQVARQLWLIAPGEADAIAPEDSAVQFSGAGPTCDVSDTTRFLMTVNPEQTEPNGFSEFATGTIQFLSRAFC